MTKTKYREYIESYDWKQRRRRFLAGCYECEICRIPRYLAVVAYDQDFHVHHLHYNTLGFESISDLQIICRRCHEMEHFSRSDLREPKNFLCPLCKCQNWDPYEMFCAYCAGSNTAIRELCRDAEITTPEQAKARATEFMTAALPSIFLVGIRGDEEVVAMLEKTAAMIAAGRVL